MRKYDSTPRMLAIGKRLVARTSRSFASQFYFSFAFLNCIDCHARKPAQKSPVSKKRLPPVTMRNIADLRACSVRTFANFREPSRNNPHFFPHKSAPLPAASSHSAPPTAPIIQPSISQPAPLGHEIKNEVGKGGKRWEMLRRGGKRWENIREKTAVPTAFSHQRQISARIRAHHSFNPLCSPGSFAANSPLPESVFYLCCIHGCAPAVFAPLLDTGF